MSIEYCKLYDLQMWNDQSLRVSTPLHAESAKRFDAVRGATPDFYKRVTEVFPEMLLQERYFKELDRDAIKLQYGQSIGGVRAWIEENLIDDERQYELAVKRLETCIRLSRNNPDMYPPDYLLKAFMSGSFKRQILPKGKK